MNQSRQDLLSIGSFASATHLSLKALRLYDQLGILKPRYIDPDSGYRYYHTDQLPTARLIRMMRQIEMPLALIRQVLGASPAEAEPLIQAYVQALEARVAQTRRLVHDLIAQFHQEEAMALSVEVRNVAPQPIVSLTARIKVDQLDDYIRAALDRLYEVIGGQAAAVGAPLGIYHGPINHDDDGPIEVCVPVAKEVNVPDGVTRRELPGGTVASVMLRGDQCEFPAILQGYDAVYDWVRSNGYEQADAPWEIWHSPPGAEAVMEVAMLFRERSGT